MTLRNWTACVLAAVLTALCFVSCSPGTDGGSAPSVTLTADELSGYTIVRSDVADDPLTRCAMRVRDAAEAAGYKLTLTTDFYREGVASFQILDTEILVGETNRPETAEFLDSLAPWQWGYALVGTKIVIAGHDIAGTQAAADAFIENILGREPLSFSDTDRYVYGDVHEGTGQVWGILTCDAEEVGDALGKRAESILDTHEEACILILRSPYAEDGTMDVPEGFAVGVDKNDGIRRICILYRTADFTFSSGDAIDLLNYPNLTPAERGSLVYTVLRSRATGEKMVFAAASLPPDTSSATRLRVVEGFLGHTGSLPAVIAGFDLGLDGKHVTTEEDCMGFGYAAAVRIAAERDGEENPGLSLFLPYEELAASVASTDADGVLYVGMQKTKK
ncbi:MAG: hypothetical protein K6G29_04575 [Clostridiales bacterium]|nr:hypothetical protein [Clostridiales bacterium]